MTKKVDSLEQQVFDFLSKLNGLSLEDWRRVDPDFNLLEAGFVDSIGFVDLLNHLQEVTQVMVDVSEVDLAELATLRGLNHHYAQACGSTTD